jgi:signal transduction histidine kinase
VLYREGVDELARGEDGTARLRAAAQIAPIDPRLYLPLARACRERGAGARAADFYRKLLAENVDEQDRRAARRELAQLGEVADPFALTPARSPAWVVAPITILAVLGIALWLRRRGGLRVDELLRLHPERAAAVAYQIGVLRHELLKHRLAPLRHGASTAPPSDPIAAAWHRHLDVLAAALGTTRARLFADPSFRAAGVAIRALAAAESRGVLAPNDALAALQGFDRRLAAWARAGEHTTLDSAWLDRLVDSLRDEHAGRRLAVHVEVEAPVASLHVAVLSQDLMLVLRNLTRNAITACEREGATKVRITTAVHVDDTGGEWARVVVHDPSDARLPPRAAEDERWRGLGLVRATLERYGGALVEVPPASGFKKALAASLPRADAFDDEAAAGQVAA